MAALNYPDLLALLYFICAWLFYSIAIERTRHSRQSLNALMHQYRDLWMQQMLYRELRMVDAQVTAALQNGTAFFASTSLIAIGGTLTLLRSTDEILSIVSTLPFAGGATRGLWEIKMLGLAVIFVYAFFKFAWAYRLYNYVAIMVGAAPPKQDRNTPLAQEIAHRTARVCEDAGRHFNRGQRAFFFALGYLGWFLGPLALIATTTGVVAVMYRRQFSSDARRAFSEQPGERRRLKRGPSRAR